jgi:hypothetical protein
MTENDLLGVELFVCLRYRNRFAGGDGSRGKAIVSPTGPPPAK